MARKKIIFLVSRFLHGGIDAVLIDYLQMLSTDGRYEVALGVGIQLDELEVFRSQVPEGVSVHYLVGSSSLTSMYKERMQRRIPLGKKIIDETILSPIRRLTLRRNLRRIAEQYDIIVDFDCTYYSLLRGINRKKILYYHFSFRQTMQQNQRRMMRIVGKAEQYDRVVTICKEMRDEAIELMPHLKDRISYIYNPKDASEIVRKSNLPIIDARLDEPFILAVERLEESQKDLTTLLKAFAIVSKAQPTLKLYILGKGRDEQRLKELAATLELGQRVVFLGFSDNPYVWMRHSKMLVHSAKFEGLPTILIEGLVLGKLMVSTDCPTGPKEVLGYGKAGMLVPVGDEKKMAEAILTLLGDKQRQADTLANVSEQVKLFSYDTVRARFYEMLDEISN